MTDRQVSVLLVEDNPGDVRLIREAFRSLQIAPNLRVASDGVDAIEYLRTNGPTRPRPDLIILDLSLPRKSGLEVLAEIKATPEIRQIPVLILSSSAADSDVHKSYDLHANSYIVKPADLSQVLNVIKAVSDFWMTTVRLPSMGAPR
ncbi:MAG TPA: response regulator [Candidatus Binataceae bacterium]|nr:response regulator [Candidatus Binataceae bacterium]